MIALASRSIGRRWRAAIGPWSSSGLPSGSITRPSNELADPHVHDTAGAGDFVSGVEVGVVSKQHDTDFVFVQVESDAEQARRETG